MVALSTASVTGNGLRDFFDFPAGFTDGLAPDAGDSMAGNRTAVDGISFVCGANLGDGLLPCCDEITPDSIMTSVGRRSEDCESGPRCWLARPGAAGFARDDFRGFMDLLSTLPRSEQLGGFAVGNVPYGDCSAVDIFPSEVSDELSLRQFEDSPFGPTMLTAMFEGCNGL